MGKSKSIHDMQYQQIIEALANERKRLNISQANLAKNLGLNQSDVSKIEKLERRLDILEFAKIIEILRIKENKKLSELISSFLGFKES